MRLFCLCAISIRWGIELVYGLLKSITILESKLAFLPFIHVRYDMYFWVLSYFFLQTQIIVDYCLFARRQQLLTISVRARV